MASRAARDNVIEASMWQCALQGLPRRPIANNRPMMSMTASPVGHYHPGGRRGILRFGAANKQLLKGVNGEEVAGSEVCEYERAMPTLAVCLSQTK